MDNELQQVAENIKDELVYQNGVIKFSIRASARLIGVDEKTVRNADKKEGKISEFLSYCGINLRNLNISENGIPDYAHAMITKYYAYHAGNHCKELARKADLVFTAIGVRAWGKQLLGINDEQKQQTEPPKSLPPELKLEYIREVQRVSTEFAEVQPKLAQELTDAMMNDITGRQKQITASNLRGVVEIACEMGYEKAKDSKIRSNLGRFVKSQVGHLAQQELRLCNGENRSINCYPDCDVVRDAIALFFER